MVSEMGKTTHQAKVTGVQSPSIFFFFLFSNMALQCYGGDSDNLLIALATGVFLLS